MLKALFPILLLPSAFSWLQEAPEPAEKQLLEELIAALDSPIHSIESLIPPPNNSPPHSAPPGFMPPKRVHFSMDSEETNNLGFTTRKGRARVIGISHRKDDFERLRRQRLMKSVRTT